MVNSWFLSKLKKLQIMNVYPNQSIEIMDSVHLTCKHSLNSNEMMDEIHQTF